MRYTDRGDIGPTWIFAMIALGALIVLLAGCTEYLNVRAVGFDAGLDTRCAAEDDSTLWAKWPWSHSDVLDSLVAEFEAGLFEGLAVGCVE